MSKLSYNTVANNVGDNVATNIWKTVHLRHMQNIQKDIQHVPIDKIVKELIKKYPDRYVFEIKCNNLFKGESEEDGFHMRSVGNVGILAVSPSYPFEFSAWLFEMDRSTMIIYQNPEK